MRMRTYEVKDSAGVVVTSGQMGWWNHTINLSDLSPHPTLGVSGIVSSRGGWCKIGQWNNPETPSTLQCSASRWATLISENLTASGDTSPMAVIDAIAKTLETLEDERLAPPVIPPVTPEEE